MKVAKDLIGSLIFLDRKSANIRDFDLSRICNSLNIARDNAVTALRRLHSVLFFPRVKDIGETRPRFYHTSFRDFLEDPSRSNEYLINVKECRSALFWGSQALADATLCCGLNKHPYTASIDYLIVISSANLVVLAQQ
ncbi:hypothetical protein P691DRAFT_817229 [Macrolepiota fuliginosa MF-IS2]|uniref:Uncharacterized protein n=1 Tax=Macrolepiota fuliginosa MF-IS2 TaxID=1400762 RepID=A0A9P5WZY5_9AGAR|nr:hypothetical protein P691DRAFT_817229 [Macrolepiota fuliginosa MF-IS2]